MAISIETLLRQDPVIERYQKEVGVTAAGILRTAILSVPGVEEAVLRSTLDVRKKCFFSNDANLSGMHQSLHLLLGGNGLTAEVLKLAKPIVEEIEFGGRNISELAEADPNAASLLIDVKGEISSFLDDVLSREK